MPIIEAMASGLPVITSANTALSEVGKDAALLIEPGDPTEIVQAINSLEQKAGLRESLIQKGLKRAEEFSWDEPARTVRHAYLQYLGLADSSADDETLIIS